MKEVEDGHLLQTRAIRLASGQSQSLVDRQVLARIVDVLAGSRTMVRYKESDADGATG